MISPFLGFVTTADAEQGSNASWAGVIILLDIAYVIKSYAPRLPAANAEYLEFSEFISSTPCSYKSIHTCLPDIEPELIIYLYIFL